MMIDTIIGAGAPARGVPRCGEPLALTSGLARTLTGRRDDGGTMTVTGTAIECAIETETEIANIIADEIVP